MNIFELLKYQWWDYMERIMENINLNDISIKRNDHMIFEFINSYNGKFCANLECSHILKCCIENQAHENEEFAYFITDIFVKELSKDEILEEFYEQLDSDYELSDEMYNVIKNIAKNLQNSTICNQKQKRYCGLILKKIKILGK